VIAKKHFNYARLYFERTLEVNCDDENIWALYIDFAKTLTKETKYLYPILRRAAKCCYSNILYWIMLFKEMERINLPREEILTKINEAYFGDDVNYKFELLKCSVEYQCRNFDGSSEQLMEVRYNFENSINIVKGKFKKINI
jgi:hypothetical protein